MTVDNLQVNEDFVRYVLDTYDLPDRTRERLERTALFGLRENEITDFDEAYTYIDKLVMEAELRPSVRMRSLDEEVGETDRTLHEIIGAEDDNIGRVFETLQSRRKLSGQEVVECLSYCLDRQDIEIISRLMEGQKVEFDVSLDYLLENAEEIGERIRQTAQRYEREGVILLPKRPIVSVSFDPFEIEFGRSRYESLTDQEKSLMAKSLVKNKGNVNKTTREIGYTWNLVDRCRREIDPNDQLRSHEIEIIPAYGLFRGNATEAGRRLGFSHNKVLRIWRKGGLEPNPSNKDKIGAEEEKTIISAYDRFNGNSEMAAKVLGYGGNTIRSHWRSAGLEVGRGYYTIHKKEEDKVAHAHLRFNGNAGRASRHLHYSRSTIARFWKKKGLEVRNSGRPGLLERDPEAFDRIVASHSEFNGHASKAANNLGYSISTITKYWREKGLKVYPRGSRKDNSIKHFT